MYAQFAFRNDGGNYVVKTRILVIFVIRIRLLLEKLRLTYIT